jgi:galactan 5-O-arabinofuranosyltransferase
LAAVDNGVALSDEPVDDRSPEPDTTETVPPEPARTGVRTTVLLVAAEAALALGAAALLAWWSRSIDVNPLVRTGQVSGLAGLQLRFASIGIVVVATVMIVARVRGSAVVPVVTRLGSAAIAGLSSGFLAGGVELALRGTNLPFFGTMRGGDFATIAKWAQSILNGHSTMDPFYPPLPVYVLVWWSKLSGTIVPFSFKNLELVGAALFGPVAYLSWRLLLRPLPALAIGVVSALPLVELYKPYENLVLIALIPVLAKLLHHVHTAADRGYRHLALLGVAFGVALAACFLSYSGWFVWSAPGFGAAILIMTPWRRGPLKALTLVGVTAVVMVGICAHQIIALLRASGSVKDTYFYFDTSVDPAYIAMWRGDLPGTVGLWPPPGELGGVGVFTLVLCVGLAAALFLGLRNTIVVTAACCLAGAWLLRFYYASQMYQQRAVQLYPRTTMEILYCLLLLTLVAVLLGWERVRTSTVALVRAGRNAVAGKALPAGVIGGFCALLLVLGSAGSATVDHYLPRDDNSMGRLAWVGQSSRMPNGHCSIYLEQDCKTVVGTHSAKTQPTRRRPPAKPKQHRTV